MNSRRLIINRIFKAPFGSKSSRSYVSVKEIVFGDDIDDNIKLEMNSSNLRCKLVNGRYVSPWAAETNKKFSDVVKLLLSEKRPPLKLPGVADNKALIETLEVDRKKMRSTVTPHVTWFGHASCYYQTNDTFFLTDPVWSDRASPFSFAGPKRFKYPSLEIEDLKVDIVLLSHTHYDHLDIKSAKRIGNKALWIVPLGVKKLLESIGITNCVELDWWNSYTHLTPKGDTIEIIFTPTKHWTSRTLFDRNTCLWGSFVVLASQSKFFFSGDTAYCSVFKTIGENFGPFDFAAVPIGAYSPRWFMKNVHCDPEEATKIHTDLRSKQSFAIHWGTFQLTDEDPIEPALELSRARDMIGIDYKNFFTMAHGETVYKNHEPQHDFSQKFPDIYAHYLQNGRNKPTIELK